MAQKDKHTDTHTDGHGDSKTNSAKRAELVKSVCTIVYVQQCMYNIVYNRQCMDKSVCTKVCVSCGGAVYTAVGSGV